MNCLLFEAQKYVSQICQTYQIDDTHGLGHALKVMNHIKLCLLDDVIYHLDQQTQNELLITGLLHDIDDHKYCPPNTHNAEDFLTIHCQPATVQRILRWISYVSTSHNGNDIPAEALEYPWVLWPRYCDRIEAVGLIGITRLLEYSHQYGIVDYLETTPRAQTYEEVMSLVTPERFEQYRHNNGVSVSSIDHIYDKLLHICDVKTDSPYIDHQLSLGKQVLVDICINYGRYGRLLFEETPQNP